MSTVLPVFFNQTGASPNNAKVMHGVLLFGAILYTFLIVVGTLGNTLSILVIWSTQSMRQSRHAFLALAIADSLCLWVNPFRYWLLSLFRVDVRALGVVACKLHCFLAYATRDCATWVLCLLTFERFLFACMPYRSRLVWRPRPRATVWASVLLLIIFKNLPLLFYLEPIEKRVSDSVSANSSHVSVICDTNAQTFRRVFFYVDISEYSVLPSLLLLFFNAALMRVLHKAKRCRRAMLSSSCTPPSNHSHHNGSSQLNQASRLLIPVSLFHLATSLPLCVFSIVEDTLNLKRNATTPGAEEMVHTIGYILSLLTFCSNASNCFIYFLSSRAFRQRFRHMLANRQSRQAFDTNSPSFMHRQSARYMPTQRTARASFNSERIHEYHSAI